MTKKVAIVTAGGSGMGAATARRLAKDGYEVATLVIDGTTVLPLTSYSFMNVDSNHTLYVTFREK